MFICSYLSGCIEKLKGLLKVLFIDILNFKFVLLSYNVFNVKFILWLNFKVLLVTKSEKYRISFISFCIEGLVLFPFPVLRTDLYTYLYTHMLLLICSMSSKICQNSTRIHLYSQYKVMAQECSNLFYFCENYLK